MINYHLELFFGKCDTFCPNLERFFGNRLCFSYFRQKSNPIFFLPTGGVVPPIEMKPPNLPDYSHIWFCPRPECTFMSFLGLKMICLVEVM